MVKWLGCQYSGVVQDEDTTYLCVGGIQWGIGTLVARDDYSNVLVNSWPCA